MVEIGEMMRPSIVERIRMRMEDAKRPAGPVSREAIRQIRKIQYVIPKGLLSQEFDKAKDGVMEKLWEKDKQARNERPWVWFNNLVKLWFYAPIVVAAFPARSSLAEDIKRIKESGKKWRKFLKKNTEGGSISDASQMLKKRIEVIASAIVAGQLPPENSTSKGVF